MILLFVLWFFLIRPEPPEPLFYGAEGWGAGWAELVDSPTGSVILNWRNNSDNEAGFRIRRCADYDLDGLCDLGMITVGLAGPNTTSAINTRLTEGRYCYQVVAFGPDLRSWRGSASKTICGTMIDSPGNGYINVEEWVTGHYDD